MSCDSSTVMDIDSDIDLDIFHLAERCLWSFAQLGAELHGRPTEFMSPKEIQDLHGRFRIWCGNLGALQQSFASLDYRLREAPVMFANICKLLQQLQSNLVESVAVVSASRPPFEAQEAPDDLSGDEELSDGDDGSEAGPQNELSMRLSSIVDLVNSLYKLGFKIRSPSVRPSPLKANMYRDVDKDTDVDLFTAYAEFDRRHVLELLDSLRQGREVPAVGNLDNDRLVSCLAASITLRRKQFRYWADHGKKLSLHRASKIEPTIAGQPLGPDDQNRGELLPRSARPPLGISDSFNHEHKTFISMTEVASKNFHVRA